MSSWLLCDHGHEDGNNKGGKDSRAATEEQEWFILAHAQVTKKKPKK